MGFDSPVYYYFLFLTYCLLLGTRHRGSILLGFSILFYVSFSWRHLPYLLGLVAISFWGARIVERRAKALPAVLSVIFAPLFSFKVLEAFGWAAPLPLGLSFYSFHCASYVIDCSRGVARPVSSGSRYALYVSFFPQLIAGPITRAGEILPQLHDIQPARAGIIEFFCWRIFRGALKKFAVANVLFLFVMPVLKEPQLFSLPVLLLAVIGGRYFVFADFSGYTDIAIGSAGLLGISLPENFRRPFAASSISEYWRRWHVTLSAWIRDYLLYPLAAGPMGRAGIAPLLLLTFLFLGAWHGLTWNFLGYGLWHGLLVVAHEFTKSARRKTCKALGLEGALWENWVFPWFTFLVFVCPPTILFLTANLGQAGGFLAALAAGGGHVSLRQLWSHRFTTALATILVLEAESYLSERSSLRSRYSHWSIGRRLVIAGLAVLWLCLSAELTGDSSFLYFRF